MSGNEARSPAAGWNPAGLHPKEESTGEKWRALVLLERLFFGRGIGGGGGVVKTAERDSKGGEGGAGRETKGRGSLLRDTTTSGRGSREDDDDDWLPLMGNFLRLSGRIRASLRKDTAQHRKLIQCRRPVGAGQKQRGILCRSITSCEGAQRSYGRANQPIGRGSTKDHETG